MNKKKRLDAWFGVKIAVLILFLILLVYPMGGILKQSVIAPDGGGFTLEYFKQFFEKSYYFTTIFNSFKVTIATTIVSMLIALPVIFLFIL